MKRGKDLRIFIVDGDPICREIYKQYFLNMGFWNIALFEKGKDCTESLTSNIPDIILVDYNMSPECLENLKKVKNTHPDIYILFAAESVNLEVTHTTTKYGAFDYILKGLKEEEMLSSAVSRILHVNEVLGTKVS